MTFLFESRLPQWMRYRAGESPLIFVAPHGGRRSADAPIKDSIKVNDLHTAELTEELAARTHGYALINRALDRNELDLNRISQVRTRAPWFLEALVELAAFLVERHGEARVFFVHGWNVVQPVCDLGMGLKQRGRGVAPASKFAAPTLSPAFFATAVQPFRAAALALGIDVAIGRRYPAADKENVMQLFSARFAQDPAPLIQRLAALSTQEKVQALQLELGVGLRWPGAERKQFVDVFCQTLGQCQALTTANGNGFATGCLETPPSETRAQRMSGTPEAYVITSAAKQSLPARERASSLAVPRNDGSLPTFQTPSQRNGALFSLYMPSSPTRFGLHFHDPLSGIGIMGGVECSGDEPTHSGRLMLSLGGTEMALFTGEDDARRSPEQVQVGGLVWRGEPDGFLITYQGPLMRFSHPHAFIRLEEGLAASWVEPAEVELRLTIPSRIDGARVPLLLAHLYGEVRLRDRVRRVDAWGFLDMLKPEEAGRLLPRRLVSLPFGPDLGIFLSLVETPAGPRSSGIVYHHGAPHYLQSDDWELQYLLQDGRPTAFHVAVRSPSSLALQCRGEPVTVIPIVRHAPQGGALNVTFGLSRTIWQGREARGVYEFSERRRERK
jgi:hypothetical protein